MADRLLPVADAATIAACEKEYLSLAAHGGGETAEACFRYAWALCHSANAAENKRGIALSEEAESHNMEGRKGSDITSREFMYIRAGAQPEPFSPTPSISAATAAVALASPADEAWDAAHRSGAVQGWELQRSAAGLSRDPGGMRGSAVPCLPQQAIPALV